MKRLLFVILVAFASSLPPTANFPRRHQRTVTDPRMPLCRARREGDQQRDRARVFHGDEQCGQFSFQDLPLGDYKITVAASVFLYLP